MALLDPPAAVAPEADVAVADQWILAADVKAPVAAQAVAVQHVEAVALVAVAHAGC